MDVDLVATSDCDYSAVAHRHGLDHAQLRIHREYGATGNHQISGRDTGRSLILARRRIGFGARL